MDNMTYVNEGSEADVGGPGGPGVPTSVYDVMGGGHPSAGLGGGGVPDPVAQAMATADAWAGFDQAWDQEDDNSGGDGGGGFDEDFSDPGGFGGSENAPW